jgi:membrane protein implicated in regulation of membrane protease activity
MAWWSWITIGTLLLCAELFAIDLQFYLVFIGIGAIIVGLVELGAPGLPGWAPWILFAVLSLTSMFTIRRHLYERIRGRAAGIANSAIGGHLTIRDALAPGHSCRAEYRGSLWTAINVGKEPIPAGGTAEIDAVDGLNLRVRSLKQS